VLICDTAPDPLTVLVPGDLEARTGGYEYDRRIVAGLRAAGWDVRVLGLDDSFPFPTPAARAAAAAALSALPDGRLVLVDGLALGALPDEAAAHASRLTIVALVHHPLSLETGLDTAQAAALEHSERRALTAARHVIVTSRPTAVALTRFGVAPDRIAVIEPGTDPAPLARVHQRREPHPVLGQRPSRAGDEPIGLLCVATLTPRKGYDILLDALAAIPCDRWRLRCAGSLDRDPGTTARVRARLRDGRLAERVTLVGDLGAARLSEEYDRADVFVLATLYEGYGMAVAEALARGLPVVSTATGAIPDLAGADAGIIVAPGDPGALADALTRVLSDGDLRTRLGEGARRVRDRLPTWDAAVGRMAGVLTQIRDRRDG
jgi:glycosyltransferase involved in cell wall biosynthesis